MVDVRIPAGLTLAALAAGLVLGLLLADSAAMPTILAIAAPVGTLWLNALQMTVVPLVAALLVLGTTDMAQAARAGASARRTVIWVMALLFASAGVAVLAMPPLLDAFPIPAGAGAFLMSGEAVDTETIPGLGAFLTSLVAPNIVAAAAATAMLPLTAFFILFALAMQHLAEPQRVLLLGLFRALGNVMLVMIGWVLKVAPVGVFALALGVAASGGSGAFATLGHYILAIIAMGTIVLIGGYLVAVFAGRQPLGRFARAMLPAQAVALSTQSSLASLPAMLASARKLGLRTETGEFVLPLSVAVLRATGPACNLGVAIYVARLAGVELSAAALATGFLMAPFISLGSVSLPGAVSFVIAIGPICMAMGIPVAPLALLVAVEMLPDIMRTLGNVTHDVAVASAVDHAARRDEGEGREAETMQP